MSKLMQHEVVSIAWIVPTSKDSVPSQDYGTMMPRLAECANIHVNNTVRTCPPLGRTESRRVDKNSVDAFKVVVLETKQEERSLGGNCHLDFIGDL